LPDKLAFLLFKRSFELFHFHSHFYCFPLTICIKSLICLAYLPLFLESPFFDPSNRPFELPIVKLVFSVLLLGLIANLLVFFVENQLLFLEFLLVLLLDFQLDLGKYKINSNFLLQFVCKSSSCSSPYAASCIYSLPYTAKYYFIERKITSSSS